MTAPLPQNRCPFTLEEVAQATGGELCCVEASAVFRGVSTDSRTVEAGQLFVALKGENFDGHDFVEEARRRGALPLVRRGSVATGPRIEVSDTLSALGALARHHLKRERDRRSLPVLAIGGAAGKTTSRSLAEAGARALFGTVLATAGNFNNRVGVPLTLLSLTEEHQALVVECGTSEPGEIAALGSILQPDVALVLNAGLEHSERLGDLEAIAREEGSLFEFARKAVVTAEDEPRLIERATATGLPTILFGTTREAAVQVVARRLLPTGGSEVHVRIQGHFRVLDSLEIRLKTGLIGPAASRNLAAALAAALALASTGLRKEEVETVASALARVPPVPGRLYPRLGSSGTLFLDDTYNANPSSLAASLAAASELAALRCGKLHLFLGDMLELGPFEAAAHREALERVAASAPATVVLVGSRFAEAQAEVSVPGAYCLARSDLLPPGTGITFDFEPDDVVLVKGSRGVRMEKLLTSLLEREPSASATG